MRKKIVAGNWKMNCDLAEMQELLTGIKNQLKNIPDSVSLMVAPAYTNLYPAFETLKETPVEVIAQNMHQAKNGAFTGEISAAMLKGIGVKTVILGHSERRSIFKEDNQLLKEKVQTALDNSMQVIFCIGEELEAREEDKAFDVVKEQLEKALFSLPQTAWKNIVVAYEPVWAIGTGKTASPQQAQEMHAFIRQQIAEKYDKETANAVSILYGGSVKPGNAEEIFSQTDVDGGLIGGAALKADSFIEIALAFQN